MASSPRERGSGREVARRCTAYGDRARNEGLTGADEAVRAAEALYLLDRLDELASGLAFDAAPAIGNDESQLAAMADVVKRFGGAAT